MTPTRQTWKSVVIIHSYIINVLKFLPCLNKVFIIIIIETFRLAFTANGKPQACSC